MPRRSRSTQQGLAARVTELRRDFGISQEEFGSRIGVRQSAISKYEKGYPMPKVVRVAIAGAFGVRLAWLDEGKPPKYQKPQEYVVTEHDLELLRFLKQQSSLYDLVRFHIGAGTRKSGRGVALASSKR
jgi:transcriptional regulator with XRE-family HTH domain